MIQSSVKFEKKEHFERRPKRIFHVHHHASRKGLINITCLKFKEFRATNAYAILLLPLHYKVCVLKFILYSRSCIMHMVIRC